MKKLEIVLREELSSELSAAASETGCRPADFAAQTVEAALAARRLPRFETLESSPQINDARKQKARTT
ncbi:MAG TPA: hypothetical protein VGG46_08570 [Terriglobales bacterium]|jgi:hypothetical protein